MVLSASTGSRRLLSAVIAATVVLSACVPAWAQSASDPSVERSQRTFTLRSGGHVDVTNERGKTTVEGWDKEQVVVDVVKRFESGSDSERAAWMSETKVLFKDDPSRVQVTVDLPNHFCMTICNWRAQVDLTLHVPRRVQLELQADRGGISVADIQGNVRIKNDRGSVEIERVTGGIHVDADRGSVSIHDVDIRDALEVRVDRGNIDFQGSGLTQGGTLTSERGNVLVRLPEDVKLQLEVPQDRRSRFRTDFPISTTSGFGGGTVRGSLNGGGPTLRLKSGRGSVSLEKARASI